MNRRPLLGLGALALLAACSQPQAPGAPGPSDAPAASAAPAPAASEPPAEVVVPGACPFEGCQYGPWKARERTRLHVSAGGPALDRWVEAGQAITALGGEVRARPQRATVKALYETDRNQGIEIGDTVYVLYPLGEGAMAVWHDGRQKDGSLDLAFNEPVQADYAWWARVRLADGTEAWLKNPDPGVFEGSGRFS